ncbi:MAG: sulfite exporter TauE/SafE family protein [Candidatus Rokuibacteriota bacterium]
MADPLVTIALGLVLGFLIGLTGVGGGALVAPALYVVLELPYADAIAVSLLFSVFTKIVGAVQHIRQGSVLWPITLTYGLAGIPGAVAGSWVVHLAGSRGERFFPFVMAAVLLLVAALLLLEATVGRVAGWAKRWSPHELGWRGALAIAAFQVLVGLLLGVTSVGSGSLVILSMVYFFRMTVPEIVGSNIVISLLMVAPASATHLAVGAVPWGVLGLLLGGSLLGALAGARATLAAPERGLKLAITGLVAAAAVATVAKAL